MCLSASLFSVSSTLYLLLRPLSSFPSSRPPCEPTERRFDPSLIVKINGFPPFFMPCLRFDLRRGPSQCAAATQRLPSISVLTKTGVCVFDPCWLMGLSSIRVSSICCLRFSSSDLPIRNVKRLSQEFFVSSFRPTHTSLQLIFFNSYLTKNPHLSLQNFMLRRVCLLKEYCCRLKSSAFLHRKLAQ